MTSFWIRRIKCAIYKLDTIFSKTRVAQLIVLKINFFCRRDIRRVKFKLYSMSGSWKMAMAHCFYGKLGRDILRNCSLGIQKCVKFQT